MITGPEANAEGKETRTVASAGTKRVESAKDLVRIEVADQNIGALWKLIADNEWSGEYLGKNIFVFTEEQLIRIRGAGIPFRTVA